MIDEIDDRRLDAERYVKALTGCAGEPGAESGTPGAPCDQVIDWASFPDDKEGGKGASLRPALRWRGPLADLWERLVAENVAGSGIFATVNETDGRGFTKDHVIGLRALFVDDDSCRIFFEDLAAAGLAPSFVVQSNAGQHNYWTLEPGEDLSDFKPAQKALAAKFGTDPRVHDLPRVLRVPGFYHMKNPAEPFLVFMETGGTGQRYTVKEVADAFHLTEAPKKSTREPRAAAPAETTALVVRPVPVETEDFLARARAAKEASPGPGSAFQTIGDIKRGSLPVRARLAEAYLRKVPPAIQGQGGDDATLRAAMVVVRDFALDEEGALEVLNGGVASAGPWEPGGWNARCEPPWDEEGLRTKITNALNHGSGDIGAKCAPLVKPDGQGGGVEVVVGSADDMVAAWPSGNSGPDGGGGEPGQEKSTLPPGQGGAPPRGPLLLSAVPETTQAVIRRQLGKPSTLAKLIGLKGMEAASAAARGICFRMNVRGDRILLDEKPVNIDNLTRDIQTYVGEVEENQLGGGEEGEKAYVKNWNETDVRNQIIGLAITNQFDPVAEYLLALPPWDGIDRFEELLDALNCKEPLPVYVSYLRKMMISAVARACDPGCKVDTMLLLHAEKGGEKKSTFFRVLSGRDEFFTDEVMDVSNKDSLMVLNRYWILEWTEMEALKRGKSREAIKGFLSRAVDSYREPFAHQPVDRPRRSIFVGSTNVKEILEDDGGNRRFWPIADVGHIDLLNVRAMREQLWAQAVAAYVNYRIVREDETRWWGLTATEQANLGWWLSAEEEIQHEERQEDFVTAPIGTELIHRWIASRAEVTISEIVTMGPEEIRTARFQNRAGQMEVAKILKAAGWEKSRTMEGGKRSRKWTRGEEAAPLAAKPNVFAIK